MHDDDPDPPKPEDDEDLLILGFHAMIFRNPKHKEVMSHCQQIMQDLRSTEGVTEERRELLAKLYYFCMVACSKTDKQDTAKYFDMAMQLAYRLGGHDALIKDRVARALTRPLISLDTRTEPQ